MELEALQETVATIKALGASLVVISAQFEKYSKLMVKKHKLTFPLLRDEGNQLASQFGLTFKLPDDLVELYNQFGIDLVRFNGSDLPVLPIPGRFILNQKGYVVSAEAFGGGQHTVTLNISANVQQQQLVPEASSLLIYGVSGMVGLAVWTIRRRSETNVRSDSV